MLRRQMRTVRDFLILIWKKESHIPKPGRHEISARLSPSGIFSAYHPHQMKGVSFQRDIYPLFEQRCFACHGPMRQIAGFSD
jgi:hypothetical protein